jgi:hypothetical protein
MEQLSPIVRLPGKAGPSPGVGLTPFLPGHITSPFLSTGLQSQHPLSPSLSPLGNKLHSYHRGSDGLFSSQTSDGDDDGLSRGLGSNRVLQFFSHDDDGGLGGSARGVKSLTSAACDGYPKFGKAYVGDFGGDVATLQGDQARQQGSLDLRVGPMLHDDDHHYDGGVAPSAAFSHRILKKEPRTRLMGQKADRVQVTAAATVTAAGRADVDASDVDGRHSGSDTPLEDSDCEGEAPQHEHAHAHARLLVATGGIASAEVKVEADGGSGLCKTEDKVHTRGSSNKRQRDVGPGLRTFSTPVNRPASMVEETPAVVRRANPCNCKKSKCLKLYVLLV